MFSRSCKSMPEPKCCTRLFSVYGAGVKLYFHFCLRCLQHDLQVGVQLHHIDGDWSGDSYSLSPFLECSWSQDYLRCRFILFSPVLTHLECCLHSNDLGVRVSVINCPPAQCVRSLLKCLCSYLIWTNFLSDPVWLSTLCECVCECMCVCRGCMCRGKQQRWQTEIETF